MAVRAGIVVTGTEVLTGRVADRNGPWLAEQLRLLGVDVGQVVVVGDRPDDLSSALEYLSAGNDLVITSGGLGPTADDLTAELVARVQGRATTLDEELEERIGGIVARFAARLGLTQDPESAAAGTRKQALVPEGATVLEPAGTAPGLVVPVADGRTGPPVVVLPGPPSELRSMWPDALATPAVRELLAGVPELRQRTLRLWGAPESELATTLRRVDHELGGLEITTCMRDGELEIVSRYQPDAEAAQERLVAAVREDFGTRLFSPDGASVDELVARALAERGWSVAVVESFTAGALAARLQRAGGPALGGIAVGPPGEAAAAPGGELPSSPISAVARLAGEVSEEAALGLARSAREAFGADVGIGVGALGKAPEAADGSHGVRLHLAVVTPDGERTRALVVPWTGETVRERTPTLVLHLLRQALDPRKHQ
jgi:nicotinamide-nucleotide amidase